MPKMLKEERYAVVQQWLDEAPSEMHLMAFSVQNVLKVKFAQLQPQGSVVVVGGKNNTGKSSILKAIGYLLCGREILPTDVIRLGQRTATLKGQVGPFKVTRVFTRVPPEKSRKGAHFTTRIKVEDAQGVECPSPSVLLKRLLGFLTFDPLEFLRLKPEEQIEQVKKLATFEVDLPAMDAEIDAVYLERREARYRLNDREARLAAVPVPPEASKVPTAAMIEELMQRLEGAAAHNNEVESQRRRKYEFQDAAAKAQKAADSYRVEAQKLLDKATELDGQTANVTLVQAVAYEFSDKHVALANYEKMEVGELVDAAAIANELREAQAAVALAGKSAQRAELRAELTQAEAEWMALDNRLEELRAARNKAMQTAVMPIAGLTIGDEELFYEGVPLNQASGAQQIRVSLAIGMANNPKIRVLRFLDGGWDMLDEDSQAMVRAEVERHKFQLWVEHVGSGKQVTVVMEDGEAKGPDVWEEAGSRK